MPFILLAAVAVLGLLVYLFSFGPAVHDREHRLPADGQRQRHVAGCSASPSSRRSSPRLVAAASLLPKQKAPVGVIAAVAVLAFLLVLAEIIQKPEGVSIGWALYVVICPDVPAGRARDRRPAARRGHHLGAGAEAEVAEVQQPQYGQYGSRTSTTASTRAHQGGPSSSVSPTRASTAAATPAARPPAVAIAAIGQQSGPPTPPTGFPTYGQPQATPSAPTGQVAGAAAVVVFVGEPVRQLAVLISGLASVNTARASKELLYR